MFSLPSSSSSSSSLLEELYTPGESPILSSKTVDHSRLVGCGEEDPLGHLGCADRGDSPLLGWEGDYDSENPLLFPSPGYERDLPQGVQQEPLLAQDLHAHPLSLKQHRDSIPVSVKSTHSHSRSNSRPASQELPLPLPASVIPQLQKRKRVSKNPSLGQVPLYAVSETSAPVAPALTTVTVIPPPPTSPHCVPLPLSPPPHVDGFHIPSASISSISTMGSTAPSTPMFVDAFNASPIKRSESSTSVSLGVHSHSRGGSSASAAASLHSLSLSLSSDASCRNAVYISDESDLEVLDYTINSPHGSVLDLEEAGNTRTIYVENSDKAHHRIGSAFLGAEEISAELKRSSTLYVGPSGSTAVEIMHKFDQATTATATTPNPTPTPPHDNTSPSSAENSPFAPSFQFSTRESGSSGGTRTSHGTSEEEQRKLQSRWSVTSSILEFPSVPPSTPANGSTLVLPLPPAPKPSDEPSEYPMPLARAPTMAPPKDVKGKRRSRRSSLVPFVSGLREKTDVVEEEKEEKGKKAFKKAMSRLHGQGLPESVDGQRGQRKRASSSFGRTEGTSISVAIEEAKREYKDVPITHTTTKRARLASLISRLSLAPSANPNIRGLGTIPGTPPTPDFPTPTQSSASSHSHHHFPKPSTASSSTGGTPRESCSVDDKGARHRHQLLDGEVNLPLSLNGNPVIGNDDQDSHGDRGLDTSGQMQGIIEQRRPSLSHSIASPPRSPSSSTFPTMPLSPTHSSHYHSRPSVSSASSGLTSPPRSPTKMRFAVNKHELIELEIPPVPLGPAPVPPGHPSSNSNPSSPVVGPLASSASSSPLMPSAIPHEFGGMDSMGGGFGMDTAKRLPSVPAPHIRITPDTIRDTRSPPPQEVHKTPTKKKKFSTMLGLRGSRSESVLRLESPHVQRSPPPASPALPGSLSAMHSPIPSPVLSGGSLTPPMMTPPMSPPPHPAAYNPTRSPLANSYSPNQERLEVRAVKNRPKSAGGGLRERFKAFGARAWHGQGKEEVPPPVPSKEGVGMAL